MSLYNELLNYGDFFPLKSAIDGPKLVSWSEGEFEYVKYNPRKNIDRYGLSITSLDGGLSGIPDLDSLQEYNTLNDTSYTEKDFTTFTPVYEENTYLQRFLEPYKIHLFRTHIIKLNPGGYFPRHRDYYQNIFNHIRLITPLKNPCTFLLEDKVLNWSPGLLYFLNTAKEHVLFNATNKPSYWLVINYNLTGSSFRTLYDNFKYK